MHRSHEHLAKIAIEICDGLLIHQVLGALKPGDIPAEIGLLQLTLVENYFVQAQQYRRAIQLKCGTRTTRSTVARPFQTKLWCSHLVVGRDHAGVGDYYGPFDAHHIFDEIPKGSLETQPLK